jgi:NADPH:quinone reductase-like Zn-dependent oxidoreductase
MLKIADNRRDIIAHEFKEVQVLHEKGILRPHVGKVFDQNQISEAQAFMENRKSIGKIVVKWNWNE